MRGNRQIDSTQPENVLASGQIQMRKVDGWETLTLSIEHAMLDLAA